ncbi:TIGR03936 family radical SAM-associated protein [Calidifontibacter terrae]
MARQRVPEGPPPAPVVQKLRVQYAKRGRLRFTSTRDFQRALERAVRRAQLPVAFSAGFHPHPRISYANAAATGTASEAEYFEIALQRECDPEQVARDLDAALPQGLDVIKVIVAPTGALADRLQGSSWNLEFADPDAPTLTSAVAGLLAEDRVEVTRMMKSGPRTFDVRSAIRSMTVEPDSRVVSIVLEHTTPAVRPDDVLNALCQVSGIEPSRPPLTTRRAQGPLDDEGTITDPLG